MSGHSSTAHPTTTSPWATLTPHGQAASPTPTLAPPPGWSSVLAGHQFTNSSTQGALVASAAQPGRVIGCALPARSDPLGTPPTFVLSNDGGATWQTHVIPYLSPGGCNAFADSRQPDTFVAFNSTICFSRDAGVTWQILEQPRGMVRPFGLVGGQLFAIVDRDYQSPGTLVQASLSTGTWSTVSQTLPPGGWEPYAAAIDPDNPALLYLSGTAAGATTNGVTAVYRSLDGDATWNVALTLPFTHWIELHTTQHQHVFAVQQDGLDGGRPNRYSTNGGATWHEIPQRMNGSGRILGVSSQGQVITATELDAETYTLYVFDPVRAAFTLLGTYRLGQGAVLMAVADGLTPALLSATPDHVWRLPLSP